MKPDFTAPAPNFTQPVKPQLDRAIPRIAAWADTAKAIVDAKKREQTMSVLDKLDLVVTRRNEFNVSLVKRADELLDRYAKADEKADRAFGKHHLQLDAEETSLDKTEAAIDRMSNMGNSSGSEPSSEKQNGGG